MRRAAIIADSHFDEHSRFEECVHVHRWIAADIAARGVDVVIHTGDVYERKSTPKERAAAADFFEQVAKVAPVVIVKGNHEARGDLPLLARLETEHPVYVVEGAEVVLTGGFAIGCLAWPSKASILAMSGAQSQAEGELVAADALRNVIRGLGQGMAIFDGPRILAAHAMVRGSTTSVGQPLVGCDFEVGVEDLNLADASFVALGHIHKGQHWSPGTLSPSGDLPTIVYPGSPRRTTFGEVERKCYVLATFDGNVCTEWELIETPCAPMLLLEDEWGQVFDDDPRVGWRVGDEPARATLEGAEVRFRYTVDADRRDEAREAADKIARGLLAAGAIEVKVEPIVNPTNSARAPEVALATTTADKLAALWKARGTTPEPERAGELFRKANELESVDAL
jgi:exonuclease SbcD